MTRSYGGRTAEQRTSQRRVALMEAALTLIAEGGVEAVTMRSVSTRAGLNDRYFYEHFADRETVLVALLDDVATTGTSRILEAVSTTSEDVSEFILIAMQTGLAYLCEDPRRGQVLIQSQATESLRTRRLAIVRTMASIMVQQGQRILHEQATDDANLELAALTLVSGILELLTMWLRGDLTLSQGRLIDFLVDMLLTNVDFGTKRVTASQR